ncbi:MAG: alcohol dehydrogenase catalytic domain-containing protein [Sciscionella sp.]
MADGAAAQALVLEAPRRLVVRELPLPNLGDDDALVRVAACGLCGTDDEQYTGELAGGFAFVPGHETVPAMLQQHHLLSACWQQPEPRHIRNVATATDTNGNRTPAYVGIGFPPRYKCPGIPPKEFR